VVKLKRWSPLPMVLGILILILLIPYYQKIDLTISYAIVFSIYLITIGLTHLKKGLSEIIFGSVLVALSLIWALINKLPLASFELIFFFSIALLYIMGGISVYFGYIPEKWFKYLSYDFDHK
jgi:hypothetical protein